MIALYALSLGWFVIAALLAYALVKQADRHGDERHIWEEQRSEIVELLHRARPRPVPSPRRPAEPSSGTEFSTKLHALKKAAGVARPAALDAVQEPGVVITPTDL